MENLILTQPFIYGILLYFLGKINKKIKPYLRIGFSAFFLSNIIYFRNMIFDFDFYIYKLSFSFTDFSYIQVLLCGTVFLLINTYISGLKKPFKDYEHYFDFILYFLFGSLILVLSSRDLFSLGISILLFNFFIIGAVFHQGYVKSVFRFIFFSHFFILLFLGTAFYIYAKLGSFTFEAFLSGLASDSFLPFTLIRVLIGLVSVFLFYSGVFPFTYLLGEMKNETYLPVSYVISFSFANIAVRGVYLVFYKLFTVKFLENIFGKIEFFSIPRLNYLFLSVIAVTLFISCIRAVLSQKPKEMITYFMISEIAFAITGLLTGNSMGISGGLFHILIITFGGYLIFFSINGISESRLNKNMPFSYMGLTAGVWAVLGLPPFSGFVSKILIFNSFLDNRLYFSFIVSLFVFSANFIFGFRILKIFMNKEIDKTSEEAGFLMWITYFGAAAVLLISGVFPGYIFRFIYTAFPGVAERVSIDIYRISFAGGSTVNTFYAGVIVLSGVLLGMISSLRKSYYNTAVNDFKSSLSKGAETYHFVLEKYFIPLNSHSMERTRSFLNRFAEKISSLSRRMLFETSAKYYIFYAVILILTVFYYSYFWR